MKKEEKTHYYFIDYKFSKITNKHIINIPFAVKICFIMDNMFARN